MPLAPPSESAGPVLDERFLLLERLGRGGMGSVYRAFDRVDQRHVAIKVLEENGEAGPSHPLSAEFDAWSRLNHPNIVHALELGRARCGPIPRGLPYLVLEYFPGIPAHRALRPGQVEAETIEDLARSVLRALAHVHDAGLLHRDLKPANVLVVPGRGGLGRVKLTDFGLATEAGRPRRLGRVSGSIPYLAPEAVLGAPLDGRADLYGLGILLHLLATGRTPFPGADPDEVIRWHLAGERIDPRRLAPAIPERVARFILRLIQRDRDARPSSASEALFALGARLARHDSPPLVPARAERAELRLALDAVRLGARRRLDLPATRSAAAALLCEARVLAQIHGLAFHRIGGSGGTRFLGRTVLRLLLDWGPDAPQAIERHRLGRGLPLGLLGRLPVPERLPEPDASSGPATDQLARRLAAFVLESAARRAMVLVVDRSAASDPLEGRIVRRIEEAVGPGAPPGSSAGGLLLVFPSATGRRVGRRAAAREGRPGAPGPPGAGG